MTYDAKSHTEFLKGLIKNESTAYIDETGDVPMIVWKGNGSKDKVR